MPVHPANRMSFVLLSGHPLQLQGLKVEADFLSGQCPSQVSGEFENMYLIYLNKGAVFSVTWEQ